MLHFLPVLLICYIFPFQLLCQQERSVYLSFDKDYISDFNLEKKNIEYKIYGITRDLVRKYTDVARLSNDSEGQMANEAIEDFKTLFDDKAELSLDFINPSQSLSVEDYIDKAREEYPSGNIPLTIQDVAIREIKEFKEQSQYFVHINLTKSLNVKTSGSELKSIPLKMILRIEGNLFDNPSVQISYVEAGQWKKKQAPTTLHLAGLILGKGFLAGGNPSNGISSSNIWSSGLTYTYIRSTKWMDKKLSYAAGLRGKYGRYASTADAGSFLSNSGTPNELQIQFLNEGQEVLDIWSAEALLGLDYAFERTFSKQKGVLFGITPRIASVSKGEFTGSIEYQEIWDNSVIVRDVFNCGLRAYEGDNAVITTYQGTDFLRNVGILLNPYYQLVTKKGSRLRMGLEAQYFFGSSLDQGDPMFLNALRETTGEMVSVEYGENSLLRAINQDANDFYIGLNVNYYWPIENATARRTEGEASPFSQDRMDDFDGKAYLILNGDISDAEAAERIKNELGPGTQFVWIINTTRLENVEIPGISNLLSVRIENNDRLKNVSFPRVREIYDQVEIQNNDFLEEFSAPLLEKMYNFECSSNFNLLRLSFPSLLSTGDQFRIYDSKKLEYLDFPKLTRTLGDFMIANCESIAAIGLNQLNEVGGNLSFERNDNLNGVHFPVLSKVAENLSIESNISLDSIYLNQLKVTRKGVSINGNDTLQHFSIPKLEETGQYLDISLNKNLKSFSLPNLNTVGTDLLISRNELLRKIRIDSLVRIGSELAINGNSMLNDVNLPNLKQVGSTARFEYNSILEELELPSLLSVGGLILNNNPKVKTLSSPEIADGGHFIFASNASLSAIDLPKLKTIYGQSEQNSNFIGMALVLSENGALQELKLEKLEKAAGNCVFQKNLVLQDLQLNQLKKLDGELRFSDHNTMTQLTFPNLDSLMGSLIIESNNGLMRVQLPKLNVIDESIAITNNNELRQLDLSQLNWVGQNCDASYNALSSASIDALLNIMANSIDDNKFKSIQLQGQLPKALPGVKGRQYISNLRAANYKVETD